MPLRLLLLLMALVSASMIAAVIYTKVLAPQAKTESEMVELVDHCLKTCIDRVKLGRGLH
jgi:hypothetical protein